MSFHSATCVPEFLSSVPMHRGLTLKSIKGSFKTPQFIIGFPFFNFFQVGNPKVLDIEIANYRCVGEALLLAILGRESGGCWFADSGQGG